MIASLFSGVGGLDLAVERVFQSEVAWHAENDPDCSAVLAQRWPGVPNLGDVTRIDWAATSDITVLAAGFPCQDVSLNGLQAGITNGTRSGLWSHVADAARIIRPDWLVFENVLGLLSNGMDVVLNDVRNIGYDLRWTVAQASDVGAIHRRRRTFGIARPRGRWPLPADARPLQRPKLPRHGVLHDGELYEMPPGPDLSRRPRYLPTPCASDVTGGGIHPDSPGRRGHSMQLIDYVLLANEPDRWADYLPAIQDWETVLGRPSPPPTEPNTTNGNPRLHVPFAEFMMGWPAGWVTDAVIPVDDGDQYSFFDAPPVDLHRSAQLRMIGNGVVDRQAEHALRVALAWA